jgi:hypothetical protein
MTPPPIRKVVVHPDGAVVHREGFLEAVGGRVSIEALPYLLDPTSVRVEAVGVGEVEVDLDPASLTPPERPALLASLEEAADALRRLQAELDGLRTERAFLVRLVPGFTDDPDRARPTATTLAGWGRADDVVDEHVAALDAHLAERTRALRDATEAHAALASRVAEESGEGAWRHFRPTRRVRARVATDGTTHVSVSYVVPGAAWSPAYVLDADPALTRGTFALRALVVQATGEDWSEVALALSTAPVGRRVDLPVLRSLRLSSRQEKPPPAFRDLPAGLDALFPPALAPAEVPEPAPLDLASELLDDAPLEAELDAAPAAAPQVRSRAAAPPAPPQPMMRPSAAARSKSSASLVGAVGGALGAVFGGAMEEAGPARQQAATAAEPRDVGLVVDELDYGQFRLAGGDAPAQRRGRLLRETEVERVRALAPSSTERFVARARALEAGSAHVAAVAWPPHHVLAGPIQGNDRVFPVDGRVDLPADGHLHSVAVSAWPAALSVSYRAVPRHDPRSFRLVEVRLEGAQGSLLPGPVDVLVGGRLELSTPWTGSAGRGQLRIGLGAEDRLRVVRNVRYKEESAGIFGGSRRLLTHVEVQVASGLPVPVRLEVVERIPVPADKETLTVELTEASPVAEVWRGEVDGPVLKGARVQRLDVPPGGEARAVLGYAVTLGAKDELVGGDRRG